MTTTEINTQEIFNRVRDHLLAQNAQSMRYVREDDDNPQCAYRGANGLKCAVGILISDEYYTPGLETRGSSSGLVADAVCASLGISELSYDQNELLAALQYTHDMYAAPEWREHLAIVASGQGLTP